MAKALKLGELEKKDADRLALLRRTFELAKEHRDELPKAAVSKPNPLDMHVALVQAQLLSREDFDRLYSRGFFLRTLLTRGPRSPEDRQTLSEVFQLRKLLSREFWVGIEERRNGPGAGGSRK